ncbi:neutral alpha-glucosidase [Thraustotheca clavata]|uniref:Glucosidase II subunit alpha n=1 Tax=Thraustotheca clavata TaxID=74557 RepID=A0A1V9ZYL8_9STRA|nr:neutral alpha-glucosidase [Thraustotheca clavata]
MALGFGNKENAAFSHDRPSATSASGKTGKFFKSILNATKHKEKKGLMSATSSTINSMHSVSDDDLERSDYTESSRHGHQTNGMKKSSLISPFPEHNPEHECPDFYAPMSRSGVLVKQANHLKNWKKRFMVLRGQSLFYYVSGAASEDSYPKGIISLVGVEVQLVDTARFKKQYCFELSHPFHRPLYLMAKNEADLTQWMSCIKSASIPTRDGIIDARESKEILYDLPPLEDVVAYQRVYYCRKKIAFCLPSYDGMNDQDKFDLRERQIKVLQDIHMYCDTFPTLLADPHLYKEIIHLTSAYLFRPFPFIPPQDPNAVFFDDGGEVDINGGFPGDFLGECTAEDQEWSVLSINYDILVRAIEYIDQLEKQVRKDFYTPRFISQLVSLFKTPSYKERQILKTVLHRLYYKLTQRRSLIRKEISNVFFEYIYESSNYYGVTELLEILGSIINGFACPIKDEHVTLLEKALIPLHSTQAYTSYHQQLMYCMIQFVSKDHALITPIVKGLLRYWPVGNAYKEIIFLVVLEELFEYVLAESDLAPLSKRIAMRLSTSMSSIQQQVADRALACWNSPACVRVMNTYEKLGQEMFDVIKPALKATMHNHWNVLTQQKAQAAYKTYYNMGYETDGNALEEEEEVVEEDIMFVSNEDPTVVNADGVGMLSAWRVLAIVGVLLCLTEAVDRSKFRRCDQSSFCSSQRLQQPKDESFSLIHTSSPPSSETPLNLYHFSLANPHKKPLYASLSFLKAGSIRVRVSEVAFEDNFDGVNENNDISKPRWQPQDVLVDKEHESFQRISTSTVTTIAPEDMAFQSFEKDVIVVLRGKTHAFAIHVFVNGVLTMSANTLGKMHYDVRHERSSESTANDAEKKDIHNGKEIADYGEDGLAIYTDGSRQQKGADEVDTTSNNAWEESFGSHTDTKKYGATAVGIDVTFHGENRFLYGIPEHATDFVLKDTITADGTPITDPYRLYNLDVFEYELNEPMALYGHIPMIVAASPKNTVGFFWFNPSETFVDVSQAPNGKTTHWMSESGWVDMFFLTGPTPHAVFDQFTALTGKAQLPPVFALGYHQCRWNYKNEADVARVNEGFDTNVIPYDVLWLDIEHTDGKRYFTWDKHAFPTPLKMQAELTHVGRKMVTIVDPHIKRDPNYPVHQDAQAQTVYILDDKGNEFDGWCWPGSSSYVDYTSPEARLWWAQQFHFDKYVGSTIDLYTWNDMNEPSVFNGPEVSMPKNAKSRAGVEHREWHNLYGYYMQRATMEGQLVRQLPSNVQLDPHAPIPISDSMHRPFVLSRSFFAGTQRFGAIWTGDNTATWEHLTYSTKMLLSMSVASLNFVGADVGGFFGNPDAELVTRWTQAAAYQPFFRGHAHHDSDRREPWVFGEPHTGRIREAIRRRYTILPYVYTVFHTCSDIGLPVMRPLWMHYTQDVASYSVEDAFLLGSDLLIKPITAPGVVQTTIYLPHGSVWYNIHESYKRLTAGTHTVNAPIDFTPVFQRGGSIIPKRWRVRRSSALMRKDPYTLIVALDEAKNAHGELYMDDEFTFAHSTSKVFSKVQFKYDNGKLVSSIEKDAFATDVTIERIVIVGLQKSGAAVHKLESSGEKVKLDSYYDSLEDTLTIRKPNLRTLSAWTLLVE